MFLKIHLKAFISYSYFFILTYGQIQNLVQYPLLPPETLLEMLDLLTEIVDELDRHLRELVLTHFDQLRLVVSVSQSQQIYDRGI